MSGINLVKTDKLIQLAKGISQLNDELGSDGVLHSVNMNSLSSGIEGSTPLFADIYIDSDLSEIIKANIKTYIRVPEGNSLSEQTILIQTEKGGTFDLKLTEHSFFSSLSKKIGEAESPVLFLFFQASNLTANNDFKDYIIELVQNRQFVFVFTDEKLSLDIVNILKSKNVWSLSSFQFDQLTGNIDTLFSTDWLVNSLAIAKTFSLARSFDGVFELLEMAVKKAGNNLKVKRAVSQQQTVKLSKPGSSNASALEILNEVKGKIQNQILTFEKGFDQRLEDFLRPQIGKLWKEAALVIESLDSFEESKAHKTMELKIPSDFEALLFHEIKEKTHEYMINDLIAMRDQLQWIQNEIQEIAAKNNIVISSLNVRFLTDIAITKILTNNIRFDKTFKSEYAVKGWMEYLNAARKYQMIAAMMISTFGLSFVRNLKQYMIPLTVVLLGIGAYSVFVSVGKERVESMKKELEKARENMLAECRRIFMDIRKDWSDVVSAHLKEQLQLIITQMEPLIKEHFLNQADQQGDEKKRIQRQLQASDLQERKLAMVEKNRELLFKENQKLQTELRQAFLTVMNTKTVAK